MTCYLQRYISLKPKSTTGSIMQSIFDLTNKIDTRVFVYFDENNLSRKSQIEHAQKLFPELIGMRIDHSTINCIPGIAGIDNDHKYLSLSRAVEIAQRIPKSLSFTHAYFVIVEDNNYMDLLSIPQKLPIGSSPYNTPCMIKVNGFILASEWWTTKRQITLWQLENTESKSKMKLLDEEFCYDTIGKIKLKIVFPVFTNKETEENSQILKKIKEEMTSFYTSKDFNFSPRNVPYTPKGISYKKIVSDVFGKYGFKINTKLTSIGFLQYEKVLNTNNFVSLELDFGTWSHSLSVTFRFNNYRVSCKLPSIYFNNSSSNQVLFNCSDDLFDQLKIYEDLYIHYHIKSIEYLDHVLGESPDWYNKRG